MRSASFDDAQDRRISRFYTLFCSKNAVVRVRRTPKPFDPAHWRWPNGQAGQALRALLDYSLLLTCPPELPWGELEDGQ
jgi:hypothetical protein